MQTSNSAPMLGSRCPNSGYKPWTNGRQDKPAPWRPDELRINKRAEQFNFTLEVDAWADVEADWQLDEESDWIDTFDPRAELEDRKQRALTAARERAARLRQRDDVYDLADEPDYPGWGRSLTFDDLHVYRLSTRPF